MKTDYKVGDWTILDNSGSIYIGMFKEMRCNIIICNPWKLLSDTLGSLSKSNGGFYNFIRSATPEEIKAAGGKINSLQLNYLIL